MILGLLADRTSLAIAILQRRQIDLAELARLVQAPPGDAESPELIPFNSAAKKALELTFREALRLGHNYIGTEHLPLALLECENDLPEPGPLHRVGIDKETFEADLGAALAALTQTNP